MALVNYVWLLILVSLTLLAGLLLVEAANLQMAARQEAETAAQRAASAFDALHEVAAAARTAEANSNADAKLRERLGECADRILNQRTSIIDWSQLDLRVFPPT